MTAHSGRRSGERRLPFAAPKAEATGSHLEARAGQPEGLRGRAVHDGRNESPAVPEECALQVGPAAGGS